MAEKRITSSMVQITDVDFTGNNMTAPGKPPGSVPLLSIPVSNVSPDKRLFIRQSLPILEYLEDINAQNVAEGTMPEMRGHTALQCARTREMMVLADEATNYFRIAAYKGTKLFQSIGVETCARTAAFALQDCHRALSTLEKLASPAGLLVDLSGEEEREAGATGAETTTVTIADCVLFSLLQYVKELYGMDITERHLRLRAFYETFAKRECASIPDDFYPLDIKTLARQWID